jgi:hypothetical protein
VIGWDHERIDKATPTPALIEIMLTPTDEGTDVKVQLSGLSAVDAAFHRQLWARHLDRIAAVFADAEPGALPGNFVGDLGCRPATAADRHCHLSAVLRPSNLEVIGPFPQPVKAEHVMLRTRLGELASPGAEP